MAKESKVDKDIQKFIGNLRQSREDAMNQLADSERRIRSIQDALSDYESREAMAAGAGETSEVSDSDTIEYTYKPGDTFGQVITDLGLKTDKGLWGDDGDVEYYAKQLDSQGVWPAGGRGNIPIGTTIKLRRRGAEEAPVTTSTPGADPRERIELMDALEKAEKERKAAKESVREAERKEDRAKDFAEQFNREKKKKQQEKELLLQAIRNALKNRR